MITLAAYIHNPHLVIEIPVQFPKRVVGSVAGGMNDMIEREKVVQDEKQSQKLVRSRLS